jgi:hypothetical protein
MYLALKQINLLLVSPKKDTFTYNSQKASSASGMVPTQTPYKKMPTATTNYAPKPRKKRTELSTAMPLKK